MLFTWSTRDLCIIFRSWHITGPITLTLSLLAIVALVAGFEALRATTARYDALLLKRREELPRMSPSPRIEHSVLSPPPLPIGVVTPFSFPFPFPSSLLAAFSWFAASRERPR